MKYTIIAISLMTGTAISARADACANAGFDASQAYQYSVTQCATYGETSVECANALSDLAGAANTLASVCNAEYAQLAGQGKTSAAQDAAGATNAAECAAEAAEAAADEAAQGEDFSGSLGVSSSYIDTAQEDAADIDLED